MTTLASTFEETQNESRWSHADQRLSQIHRRKANGQQLAVNRSIQLTLFHHHPLSRTRSLRPSDRDLAIQQLPLARWDKQFAPHGYM